MEIYFLHKPFFLLFFDVFNLRAVLRGVKRTFAIAMTITYLEGVLFLLAH
jgi:hypothetical protein